MTANVLFVNHAGRMSGAERSLLGLATSLDPARFRVGLACPEGDLGEAARAAGLAHHPVPLRRLRRTIRPDRLVAYARAWRAGRAALAEVVRNGRYNLLHANSTTAQLHVALAVRGCGVRCVWHVRDLSSLWPVAGYCARHAHAIVCISEAVAGHVRSAVGDGAPVQVIHNGIDSDAFAARAAPLDLRGSYGWPPDSLVATMIGQFVPWKRHEDFVRAIQLLRGRPGCDVRGVVVGDDLFGDHRPLVEWMARAQARPELVGRLRNLGWRDDVPAILAASDVVVIPSLAEPFGRVALEAMALGKPVVGTAAGGLPEVVEHDVTGLLVPPMNVAALAGALARLAQDRALRRRLGQGGHRRVRERFGLQAAARSAEALYDVLLARGSGGAP